MIKPFLLAVFLIFSAAKSQANIDILSQKEISAYQQDINKIEKHLNKITTLIATFIQLDSQGNQAEGTFYLKRPGKLRWEYNPPTPILILANGSLVTYHDKELKETSYISIGDDLANFLTREVISFQSDDIAIVAYNKTNQDISITIGQKEKLDEGLLTLVFDNKTSEIKTMQMLDSIGKTTNIYFNSKIYDKPIENNMFYLKNKEEKDAKL